MPSVPEEIDAALRRSYLDIDYVLISEYIESLLANLKDCRDDIKELTGQRVHDEADAGTTDKQNYRKG